MLFQCLIIDDGRTDIPHTTIMRDPLSLAKAIPSASDVYIVCRRGNDSLVDARIAKQQATEHNFTGRIVDVRGGLQAWHSLVPEFPLY